jgi:hypothetical protein
MTNKTCDKIRLLLVDYSDGSLPADRARQMADHLAECALCREELRLLEHSLELAREVWNEAATGESLADSQKITIRPELSGLNIRSKPSAFRRQVAWISGAVAIIALIALTFIGKAVFSPSKPLDDTTQSIALTNNNATQNTTAKPSVEMDAMEYIAREERSARLAASVELLAAQPGLEQYKENAERYLKETYTDTAAVRMLDKQQTHPH